MRHSNISLTRFNQRCSENGLRRTRTAGVAWALGSLCLSLAGCGGDAITEETLTLGALDAPLWAASGEDWPERIIPVCWAATSGNDTEKSWVRDEATRSWQAYADVKFTGWGNCPAGFSRGIRITGGTLMLTTGLGVDDGINEMELDFTSDAETHWERCAANSLNREDCIRAESTHEFGHALAFEHEQNRITDPSDACFVFKTDPAATSYEELTAYDPDSIMSYCDPLNTTLSALDIKGIITLYGAASNAPVDLNADGRHEVFRYDPSAGRVVVTTFNNALNNFTNHYDDIGWGSNRQMHFADLDGSGDDEVFRYDSAAGRVVITTFNNPLNSFTNHYDDTGWGANRQMHFADLNADGRDEVFRYDPASGQVVVTKFKDGLSEFSNTYNDTGWGANWQMHFADLNGDGNDEVFRYEPGTGRVRITTFNGTLDGFTNHYDNTGWSANWQIFFADLDGDRIDEVFRYEPIVGRVRVTKFNTDLTLISNKYDSTGWGNNWQMHFADLNGDGKDEVIRYEPSTGRLKVTKFNATLTGVTNTYDNTGWGANRQISFADLNADARAEIFRYDPASGRVVVTTFNDALNAFSNAYDNTGWGANRTIQLSNKSYYRSY
jgi:hypothetical protein